MRSGVCGRYCVCVRAVGVHLYTQECQEVSLCVCVCVCVSRKWPWACGPLMSLMWNTKVHNSRWESRWLNLHYSWNCPVPLPGNSYPRLLFICYDGLTKTFALNGEKYLAKKTKERPRYIMWGKPDMAMPESQDVYHRFTTLIRCPGFTEWWLWLGVTVPIFPSCGACPGYSACLIETFTHDRPLPLH